MGVVFLKGGTGSDRGKVPGLCSCPSLHESGGGGESPARDFYNQ